MEFQNELIGESVVKRMDFDRSIHRLGLTEEGSEAKQVLFNAFMDGTMDYRQAGFAVLNEDASCFGYYASFAEVTGRGEDMFARFLERLESYIKQLRTGELDTN